MPTRIPSKSQGSSTSAEEQPGEPRLAPIFESAAVKLFVEENEEHMELTRLQARWPDDGPGVIEYLLLAGDQSLFRSFFGVQPKTVNLQCEFHQRSSDVAEGVGCGIGTAATGVQAAGNGENEKSAE